jgi:uncharacterized membrane protein YkvA (DUF1232 family)
VSPVTLWLLIAGTTLVIYALFVVALLVSGRRTDARALGGFIPDCVVLLKWLLGDVRVPRRRKAVLLGLLAYLLVPLDLIPDFVPVAGQLDDAIIAAFALRYVLRSRDRRSSTSIGPAQSRRAISSSVLRSVAGRPSKPPGCGTGTSKVSSVYPFGYPARLQAASSASGLLADMRGLVRDHKPRLGSPRNAQ